MTSFAQLEKLRKYARQQGVTLRDLALRSAAKRAAEARRRKAMALPKDPWWTR